MPDPRQPTRGPARRAPYVAVGVLIAIGIVLPLAVPTYATAKPALGGIPFFYWYQMAWVFADAVILFVCFAVVRHEDRRRRGAVVRDRLERSGR